MKEWRVGRGGVRVDDKVEEWKVRDRMMKGREQKNRVSEVDEVKDAECLEEVLKFTESGIRRSKKERKEDG